MLTSVAASCAGRSLPVGPPCLQAKRSFDRGFRALHAAHRRPLRSSRQLFAGCAHSFQLLCVRCLHKLLRAYRPVLAWQRAFAASSATDIECHTRLSRVPDTCVPEAAGECVRMLLVGERSVFAHQLLTSHAGCVQQAEALNKPLRSLEASGEPAGAG